jgi:hypothetical protein
VLARPGLAGEEQGHGHVVLGRGRQADRVAPHVTARGHDDRPSALEGDVTGGAGECRAAVAPRDRGRVDGERGAEGVLDADPQRVAALAEVRDHPDGLVGQHGGGELLLGLCPRGEPQPVTLLVGRRGHGHGREGRGDRCRRDQ